MFIFFNKQSNNIQLIYQYKKCYKKRPIPKGEIKMDEQNKNLTPDEQVPSGFDSVTNITPEDNSKFNPTPMFASLNKENNEGFTVTSEGSFLTRTMSKKSQSLKIPRQKWLMHKKKMLQKMILQRMIL